MRDWLYEMIGIRAPVAVFAFLGSLLGMAHGNQKITARQAFFQLGAGLLCGVVGTGAVLHVYALPEAFTIGVAAFLGIGGWNIVAACRDWWLRFRINWKIGDQIDRLERSNREEKE